MKRGDTWLWYVCLVIIVLSAALSVAWGDAPAQAAAPALPPRPTTTAQPAPTLTSVPTPTPRAPAPAPTTPPVAVIELRAWPAVVEQWTVVQWQDALNGWHDVEGWRGEFDEVKDNIGRKTWWVAQKDFGTGPFRWAIYTKQHGRLLTVSEAFYLPGSDGDRLQIEVALNKR